MTSKFTIISAQIRQYDEGKTYDNRDPYKCIATLQYLTEDCVYLSGTMGSLDLRDFADELRSQGIKSFYFERHGVIRYREL